MRYTCFLEVVCLEMNPTLNAMVSSFPQTKSPMDVEDLKLEDQRDFPRPDGIGVQRIRSVSILVPDVWRCDVNLDLTVIVGKTMKWKLWLDE